MAGTREYYGNKELSWNKRILSTICEGFSKIATSLTALTRKGKKFKWTQKCEENFQELKWKLTSAPLNNS